MFGLEEYYYLGTEVKSHQEAEDYLLQALINASGATDFNTCVIEDEEDYGTFKFTYEEDGETYEGEIEYEFEIDEEE